MIISPNPEHVLLRLYGGRGDINEMYNNNNI